MSSGLPAAGGAPAIEPAPDIVPEPVDRASYIFDPAQLRTYNLVVAPSDLALIDQSPSAEMYVPASMEFEGKSYGPYRMRYKGQGGAFEPPCTVTGATVATPKAGKCSIKVDFDVDNGADFFGLKKLNFHSMNHDDALLRERLAYQLFREMGIAAPRAVHARLLINGQLEGLFAVVEQIDGRFVRSRFGDGGKGNVYKEVWPTYSDPSTYIAALETNDKHPDVQRMLDFKAAVDMGNAAFSHFIDRDYMLRYIAVDRVIANDDGVFHFWCGAYAQGNNPGPYGNHNYYWYEAAAAERFWLIPWDLDFAFAGRADDIVYPKWTTDAPCVCGYALYGLQRPASCDQIVKYFKDWLPDYERVVDSFIAGPFQSERVNSELDAWAAQITGAANEAAGLKGAPTFSAWMRAVAQLKTTIAGLRQNRGRMYP